MKKKIIISVFLISIAMVYSFNSFKGFSYLKESISMKTESDDPQDQFILGAMYDSRDSVYSYLSDTLNFNIWHKYTIPNGWGWPILGSNNALSSDVLDTPVYRYSSDIRQRISVNNSKNLMTLLDRPKFEYLAFGQRSDYQCEQAINVDPDYWFYTYYNSKDNDISINDIQDFTYGNGEYVKRCLYTQANPGVNAQMLFDSLKGNMEQTNTYWPVTWLGDSKYKWFIMPRIRIDSSFANNPSNQDIEVCKIIIKNRDGDSLTQVIKVKHFKQDSLGSIYHGNYLEIFNHYDLDPLTNLIIPSGHWFNNHPDISFGGDTQCRVDFKVFWYDKCDMWIDRIRVEDFPAHELLTLHTPKVEEWIRAEVQDIAMAEIGTGNESPYKFYIEEFEMNHLPCIGYLNKKIIEYSGGRLSLMVNYNHDLIKAFIPNSWTKLFSASQAKKYLIDSAGLREIFTECYNLEGWRNNEHNGGRESYVPNTLYNGQDYQLNSGLLVYKKSPSEYDDWIQQHFDDYSLPGLNLKHIFQFSDSISKSANIPFFNLTQVHMWCSPGHMLKEPTNEEIELINTLAVSYGAKGILYFAWDSNNDGFDTTGGHNYSRGLTNHDDTPRRLNVYGQNKWEGIKSIDKKLKKLGPYIMSFDTIRRSYIYRIPNERTEMSSSTFIKELKTYPAREFAPDPIPDLTGLTPETNNNAYLQAAFFHKENETEQTKYFMIVNRRCSPFIDYSSADKIGGSRLVTMKINPSNLPGFTNWKIYDLETGDTSLTFSKFDTTNSVFVGGFLPGEGKLFKLAPVMQEGGTLVTNEQVEGITFVCNGLVYNNGKDVSILEGTKINFKTGAGINMTGGKLTCSNYSTNTSENVLLKGYNGPWNGIVMNNCMRSVIQRTRFEDAKNCIVISNDNGVSKYIAKVIRRNYFKVTADSGKALTINNQMEMAIDSNTFEVTSFDYTAGIYYVNNDNTEPEEMPQAEEGIPEDEIGAGYINITKNTFSGAYLPVMINDMGSNFSQFYICNNEFINTGLFGVTGRKITGTIKQNKFTDEAQSYCLSLYDCSPDISGNIFRSENKNIALASSFPLLGPIRNENNQLVFKGGRNILTITSTTVAADNIFMKNSLPEIYLGENNFTIGNTYSNHIYGSTPSQIQRIFRAGRNCWDGDNSMPRIFLYEGTNFNPIGYDYLPTSCIPSEEITPEIAGVGFGISDTTIVINYDSTDILMSDQSLAYEAKDLLGSGDYSGAIANYKALIDTYDSSEFIYGAVDYLYSCYQSLDTSSDEATTDILYSDLKEYLESKISSGNYDEAFEEHAFDFVLMCDTRLTNYNEALAGYEFIVTYNPDMEVRLLASWEYQNIQDLLEGESGGRSNYELQITNYEFNKNEKELYNNLEEEKRIKQLDELIDRDPVKKHLKEKFVKSADENIKAVKEGKAIKKNPKDEKFMERSKQNIYGSRNLTKQQKEIRRFEDLKLLLNPDNLVVNKNIENAVPPEYSLSQNYPNPFNPATHLEFGIPNLGFVSLKVFDILGREVKTLVNEIRPAGRFKVEFDGSNFASGVYFYRIEAGDFVQTKRMVLVK